MTQIFVSTEREDRPTPLYRSVLRGGDDTRYFIEEGVDIKKEERMQ
jgi:hypothetical protein